jgi:DNA replication protein DnaC
MNLQTNPQLELAFDYVRNTDKSLFLTGKAGSGKTTFLHQIKADGRKRLAVVAPTGVAAINAGGMTIHSLFQLPLGSICQAFQRSENSQQRRFSRQKIRLIRSLDLLVIDEISMVRADLLDAVDDVLRRYRDPFGRLAECNC